MIESKGKKRWAYVVLFFMIYTLFNPFFQVTGGAIKIVYGEEGTFAGGSGTADDPYQIATAEQLDLIRNFPDKHYRQTGDIDLGVEPYSIGEGWVPIGRINDSEPFTGSFNGNGYLIENLFINKYRPDGVFDGQGYLGLFGHAHGAEFKNIQLSSAHVESNAWNIGILLGDGQHVKIDNCHVEGTLKGGHYVGGLTGYLMTGEVHGSSASVNVEATEHTAGGLIGFATRDLHNRTLVHRSFVEGRVESKGTFAGGLIGSAQHTGVSESYSTAEVKSTGEFAGGLVGRGNSGVRIENSYNLGSVEGFGEAGGIVGGFLSVSGMEINNAYSTGTVTGTYDLGGIVGKKGGGEVHYSYYNQEISGQTDTGKGEPRTTAELTYVPSDNTYQNWDFGGIWTLNGSDNLGYPALAWQGFDNEFSYFAGGNGSEENPYLISNAEELNRVRNYPGEGIHFKQIGDIDLGVSPWNEGEGWEPIGADYENRFQGSYDGDGHKILNLIIRAESSGNYGLFGVIGGGAEIKNLSLMNGYVHATKNEGFTASAGLLAGSSYNGLISFIKGEGTVSGGNNTGGLIGAAQQGGMILDSGFTGSVEGLNGVGGIAGITWYSGDFMRNSVDADILGEEAVGGLVGANDLWRFFRNYSTGKVTGDLEVGGLVGMSGGQISAGYSSADVEGGDQVGGLVGLLCFTNGNSPSTVYDSYAVGSVNLSGDTGRIGGLIGEIREEKDISRRGSVNQSYYDMTATGQSDEGKGFGRTTEEMFKQSTFEDWDFENLWWIDEGKAYPVLRIFMEDETPSVYKIIITEKNTAGGEKEITVDVEEGESVLITIEDQNQDLEELTVTLPIETLNYLKNEEMRLEIQTPYGKILFSKDEIRKMMVPEGAEELQFTIKPLREDNEKESLLERMFAVDSLKTMLRGKTVKYSGMPVVIEGAFSGAEAMVLLPIDGEFDETWEYYVYIEHSDGQKVLMEGAIVDFAEGGKGVQVTVDHFSTFMVIGLGDEPVDETPDPDKDKDEEEATAPDEKTETEESDAADQEKDAESVTSPKLGDQGNFWNVLLLILSSFVVLATLRQKRRSDES